MYRNVLFRVKVFFKKVILVLLECLNKYFEIIELFIIRFEEIDLEYFGGLDFNVVFELWLIFFN